MGNRSYDRDFKLNAVKLYREGNKSLRAVAEDLGLLTLNTWVKEFKEEGENSFPGSGKLKPCNEEMYLLRKELASVKQERDILKKATAILNSKKGKLKRNARNYSVEKMALVLGVSRGISQ